MLFGRGPHGRFDFVVEVGEELLSEDSGQSKKSSEEIRALWKKAILETLLLIRMEKENSTLLGTVFLNLITKTRPGNIQQFFMVVKKIIFR